MKRKFFFLWLTLCAVVWLTPCAMGTDEATPVIQISSQSAEGGTRSFTAGLSGADVRGSLFVTVYSETGRMEQFATYNAEASTQVTLLGVDETDRIQTLWVNESYAPLAGVEVQDGSTFSGESFETNLAKMLQVYSGIDDSPGPENASEYLLRRVIVSSSSALPNLDEYNVAARVSNTDGLTVLQFNSAVDAKNCAEYLEGKISGDGYVEPDTLMRVTPEEVEDGAGAEATAMSWGVAKIHADNYAADLVNRGKTRTITVAVIDTGVDYNHSFLKSRMVSGYDFIDNDSDPKDEHYHGTHVAGTIVDCTPGLNIKIMPVRVLDKNGSGSSLGVSLGIRYAADHGADVINMSLGGGHADSMDEAVKYAVSKNVIVVVAAGNESDDAKNHCPAHIPDCITVSAVDSSFKPAYFTNYGTLVDIAAPGVDIKSCAPGGGTKTLNGTSMASPHVAGCVALLCCDFQGLTPSLAASKLKDNLQKPSNWNTRYGPGVVDMQKFIVYDPDPDPNGFYALLYSNGELVFQNSKTPASGRTLLETYPLSPSAAGADYAKWHSRRADIKTVTFAETVKPTSTALWFYDFSNLTTVNGLGKLNVSEVTNMNQMFARCSQLTSLDLSQWNTGKVTDMSQMFIDCSKLQTLNLKNWNTSNVTSMRDMFNGCSALKDIQADSSFRVTQVTEGSRMFTGCTSLVGGNGTKYDPSRTDKTYARVDAPGQPGYFSDGQSTGLYAILYNDGELVFQNSRTPASGRTTLGTYPISSASGGNSEYAGWYDQRTKITKVTIAETVKPASTALWFYDCSNLRTVNGLSKLDTSSVTSMRQMFQQCSALTSLDLRDLNTGSVKDMTQMFMDCTSLQTLNLRKWSTSSLTSMKDMFKGCSALAKIEADTTFTVSNVPSGTSVFEGCTSLVGGFGTKYSSSKVDKTYARPDTESNSGYFTDKVCQVPPPSSKLYAILYTNGELVFQNSLTPQSGKTAQKTYETDSGGYNGDVYAAWYEERSQIRTVSFATAIAPSSTAQWFYECENLTAVNNLSNLYTDYVKDMSQMFTYCSKLTSLDLSGFNTSKTTNTASMFYECTSLRTIYASSSFATSAITDSRRMFDGCTALQGGNGTKYSSSYIDKTYARIDKSSTPGYFTEK